MDRVRRIMLLYTGVFTASVAAGVARPSIAFYVRYGLGSSMIAAASLTSGFMFGRAAASFASGLLGELLPRYRWLIVALGLSSAASILYYGIPGSDEASEVILLMGFWGIISGLVWPSMQVAASELGGLRSGTVLSIYFALGSVGSSIGNWLFGALSYPPISLVRLSGLLIVVAGILLSLSTRGLRAERSSSIRKAVFRVLDPAILWVILAAFSLGFLSGMLREYFYLYVHEVYGLTRRGLGDLLLTAGLASVLAGIAAGVLSDRHGVHRVLIIVVLVAASSSIALGLPYIGLWGIALAYIAASSGVRASLPLTRNAAITGGTGGSFMVGASNTSSSLGMMTGPIIAGLLYGSSAEHAGAPFIVAGILLLATAAAYILARRTRNNP